jgi:hypothetical protein
MLYSGGGLGMFRGGNLQPLMSGIRNYLMQKENPQIDNFLQNLSQQIESFPNNQEGGEIVDNLSEPSPQQFYPGFGSISRPFITPRGGYRQDFSRTTHDPRAYEMDTGFSLEKGLNFLFGR